MRSVLLVNVVLVLAACGGASPGGTCNTTGFLCFDGSNAMECQLGTWVELPCRGPTGCANSGTEVTCDMSKDEAGDACASTAVGSGLCTTDGLATLECRNDPTSGKNALVQTNTCRTCGVMTDPTTSAEVVTCQP